VPFVPTPVEKCVGCNQTVYATDKQTVVTGGKSLVYHAACIRCAYCNKILGTNYTSHHEKFYCKPHFKQLFNSKGNYDDGFGAVNKAVAPAPVSGPTSFVPEPEKAYQAKKGETPDHIKEKLKAAREGATEKCVVCEQAVLNNERLVLETAKSKAILHGNCFKCCNADCKMTLTVGSYGFQGGKFYCPKHFKEVTAVDKYAAAGPTQTSFVPEPEKAYQTKKGETPEHIKNAFKPAGDKEFCPACNKTVLFTEKYIHEELKQKIVYHRACIKCVQCQSGCINGYGRFEGKIYCDAHLKQYAKPQMVKDAGFISPMKKDEPDQELTDEPEPEQMDQKRPESSGEEESVEAMQQRLKKIEEEAENSDKE